VKKIEFGQTLSILANVGVIAGIFFLALELRQNNQFAAAEAQAVRYMAAVEAFSITAENRELAEILLKSANDEPLSPLEARRLGSYWMRTLVLNQWGYKSIPPDEYIPFLEMQRRNHRSHKSYRETFESNLLIFEPDFADFMRTSVFGE